MYGYLIELKLLITTFIEPLINYLIFYSLHLYYHYYLDVVGCAFYFQFIIIFHYKYKGYKLQISLLKIRMIKLLLSFLILFYFKSVLTQLSIEC